MPKAKTGFSFHLDNVDVQEAIFLGRICAIFCDPSLRDVRNQLKQGTLLLGMDPVTGRPFHHETDGRIPPNSNN